MWHEEPNHRASVKPRPIHIPQTLPSPSDWEKVNERLSSIFGVKLSTRQLSGFAVERAGIELARLVADHALAVTALVEKVRDRCTELGINEVAFPRLQSALAAQALLAAVATAPDDLTRVEALAATEIPTSALALGKSITSAHAIAAELDAAQFPIILAAIARPEGAHLGPELASALEADELVTALVPVLHRVQQQAIELITGPPLPPPFPPRHPIGSGRAAISKRLGRSSTIFKRELRPGISRRMRSRSPFPGMRRTPTVAADEPAGRHA